LFEALDSFSDSTLALIESNAFWSMTQAKVRPQFLNKLITKSDERLVREFMFYRHRFTKYVTHSMASEVIVGLHYLERYKGQEALEELTGKELEIASLSSTPRLPSSTTLRQVPSMMTGSLVAGIAPSTTVTSASIRHSAASSDC
jgi:hypothetical protein